MLNPYAFNFAIRRSCERQSKPFDQSVRNAPNNLLLSVADLHFSSIDTRQCWTLKPLPKSILIFREKRIFKIFWHLFKHDPFIQLGDVWQYTNWSVTFFCTFWVLFMNRCYICPFQQWWIWGGINTAIKIWEFRFSETDILSFTFFWKPLLQLEGSQNF